MSILIAWAEHCPVYNWTDFLAISGIFVWVILVLTPANKSKEPKA